jgi:hypothetical protein
MIILIVPYIDCIQQRFTGSAEATVRIDSPILAQATGSLVKELQFIQCLADAEQVFFGL